MTLPVDLSLRPLTDIVGIVESITAVMVAMRRVQVVLAAVMVATMTMGAMRMMLTVTLANTTTVPTVVTLHGRLLIVTAFNIAPVAVSSFATAKLARTNPDRLGPCGR
jgi:predicted tellurium resistance membrane protein TerC